MEITINVDILNAHDLSLSEYVYLKALYEHRSQEEMVLIFSCIDKVEEDGLQERGFIKITADNKVILRDKGTKLFESANLFLKFLTTFPIKAPSGRYLSPLKSGTVKADKLEKKWVKLFKNKPHLEKRAIEVLEAELKWRRDNNKMEFIHNAEAWLNQGDYENFEYLLDEYKKDTQTFTDFM
jgi:hypothetical protein